LAIRLNPKRSPENGTDEGLRKCKNLYRSI
jgi:hypothetical protein